jgi:uncharacterized RDD family membrane protein YckC
MAYESFLLVGVLFLLTYPTLSMLGWTYPLPDGRRWVLQAVLFVGVGAYFTWCWTRSGQTLAMKTWRLRVVGNEGGPPGWRAAVVRYLVAWHLFVPGVLYIWLTGAGPAASVTALPAGAALLVLLSGFETRRRLLHDRLAGTCVERAPGPPPPRRTGPPGPSETIRS